MRRIKKYLLRLFFFILLLFIAVWIFIAYRAFKAEPLPLWNTYVLKEMTVKEINAADWQAYIRHEDKLFAELQREVTEKLPLEDRTPMNRYYEASIVHPPRLPENWNRSYIMRPAGEPAGAVVLLHGLTDTPYSLRHLARLYVERDYIVVAPRLPGHGMLPSGLVNATWEDWLAVTRLAVREAISHTGKDKPLHIIGFSNGGALAVKYTLDVLDDPSLHRPDRVVLLSPMIGITRLAQFAWLTAIPAKISFLARASWLAVKPEFNPFKYNSFPVNGATQSNRLTGELQRQIVRLSQTEKFASLPPILTFQSVLDYTVSTAAILYHLYAYLPENGSELMLFDINKASLLRPLMRISAERALDRMLPTTPQRYTLSMVMNRSPGDVRVAIVSRAPGSMEEKKEELDFIYPKTVFSLSHGAIPFPVDDPLYGMAPSPEMAVRYGVNLGGLNLRGERGALLVSMDAMLRMSSNPFFSLLLERVEKGIDIPSVPVNKAQIMAAPAPIPVEAEKMMKDFSQEKEGQEFEEALF